jgi:hypothetical protein
MSHHTRLWIFFLSTSDKNLHSKQMLQSSTRIIAAFHSLGAKSVSPLYTLQVTHMEQIESAIDCSCEVIAHVK